MADLAPLTMTGVTVRRKGRTILGPVDLTLAPGGLTVVIGPNGSGKTTLLRVMHGIERVSSGTCDWGMPPRAAQAHQAYVFQQPIVLRRSVAENLAYPLTLAGMARRDTGPLVRDWAQRSGLAALLDTQATRLSGGERQKLALARALIRQPKVLFLDEPCANLDGRATRDIEQLLHDTRAAGVRIIMATHDMGQARRLASDAIFMRGGRVHATGLPDVILHTPTDPILRAFLSGDIIT